MPPSTHPRMRAWQLLSVALLLAVVLVLRAAAEGEFSHLNILEPMCMALLLSLTVPASWDGKDRYARWVTYGMLFAFAANIALLRSTDGAIMATIALSFAHLAFLFAFTHDGGFSPGRATGGGLAALGATLMAMAWPTYRPLRLSALVDMLVVLVYLLVMLAMAWQGVERSRQRAHEGAWWGGVGALFLVPSDTALGLISFPSHVQPPRVIPLAIFYVALWMIATSVLVRAGRLAR